MKKFLLIFMIGAFLFTGCDNSVVESSAVNEATSVSRSASQPPTWDPGTVYNKDLVTWKGVTYYAKWWTQGEEPGTTGQWGVWEERGGVVIPEVTLNFTTTTNTVLKGDSVTLSWSTENAATVVASGSWTGNKALSGTETIAINADSSFILTATDADGKTAVKAIDITVSTVDDGLQVGQSRVLTDQQVLDRYNGIDPNFLPSAVANSINSLMSQAEYELLFPRRYGTALWTETSGVVDEEYYTYTNLINAYKSLAEIMLRVETKSYTHKVYRLDKATKTETLLKKSAEWDASWLVGKPIKVEIVDYGKFTNEGSLEVRKRDLAAFLANIAHETTGGWDTAPGGRFAWGLYFKQEVGHDDNSVGGYTDAGNVDYPPNTAESYHGRGPMQLSWNYNYGYMSQIVYGDKSILLNNPDLVAQDGALGFMTAIWFWMTPQDPKPACHDVMAGNWVPTAEDIAANRLPGFGVTINVINGGLEAGRPDDYRVKDRIGFFDVITKEFGITMGENVDCYTQQPF